jgi:hypothetical protein
VFDDLWIQQKKLLLKVLRNNIRMNSHSMYLKKSKDTICQWVNSRVGKNIEEEDLSQDDNFHFANLKLPNLQKSRIFDLSK